MYSPANLRAHTQVYCTRRSVHIVPGTMIPNIGSYNRKGAATIRRVTVTIEIHSFTNNDGAHQMTIVILTLRRKPESRASSSQIQWAKQQVPRNINWSLALQDMMCSPNIDRLQLKLFAKGTHTYAQLARCTLGPHSIFQSCTITSLYHWSYY